MSNRKHLWKTGLALTGAAAMVVPLAAFTPAASARVIKPPVPDTAVSELYARPDSGGNGFWAYDTITRTLTLTYLGKGGPAGTPYVYTASLSDKGTFLDIPGAYRPNQGGKQLGKTLGIRQVEGTMSGTGEFAVFYASEPAVTGHGMLKHTLVLVPGYVRGAKDPSSSWPELAFPEGTTFVTPGAAAGSLNEFDFDYAYLVTFTQKVHGKNVTVTQRWEDSAANGAGQYYPADGQISGR